jgi:ABC-type lipoprotein export system ATPase subunit
MTSLHFPRQWPGESKEPRERAQDWIIVGNKLTKDFQLGDQWVHALREVDLRIPRGQFMAIMGPSGSGKSTLLYMLGGLDRPSSGAILFDGQRIDGMDGEELAQFRRETIGFIFQAFHLVPTLTALENVALPGVFANMPRDQREVRAMRLLQALGMAERMDHRPNQLSGGQQQRVAIARALFNNPPVIMADEPTGALDSKTGQTVMQMLRYFAKKRGKTVIVVTHDPNVASYADRMLLLRDGEIVEDQQLTAESRQHLLNEAAAPLPDAHDSSEDFTDELD